MKLSKKGEYTLRALIDLGIAQSMGRDFIQVSELARQEELPVKFLEQILLDLRRAGIITTKRGKYGGYAIARPLGTIVVGDVIRLIDGPLAPISCVSQSAYQRCTCPDEDHCGLRLLMMDVRNAVSNILDRYSLEDIVGVTMKNMKRDGVPIPFHPTTSQAKARPVRKRRSPGDEGKRGKPSGR
ncbi:MAG: Rrf2 family transcriptional regulator [Puniceicoccaceae bacterium]|nr:MAG: Rrf2 family transcriptional regulator [Puniceicoccaceae bacterium]